MYVQSVCISVLFDHVCIIVLFVCISVIFDHECMIMFDHICLYNSYVFEYCLIMFLQAIFISVVFYHGYADHNIWCCYLFCAVNGFI